MPRLILDCDLMKYPFSGLYRYCQSLSLHINQLLAGEGQPPMQMYLPRKKRLSLPPQSYHLPERKWHRFFQPFLLDCRLWHAPFQSGRVLPDKKRFPHLNVVLTIHDLNVLHEGKPDFVQQKSLAHTQSLIDRSDAIVCISEFTKTDVFSHCRVGNKPVHVIHNGVDKLPPAGTAVSAYRPDREFLLGLGYLNPKKNFHVLLPLLQTNPELELLIIGHHDDLEYVAGLKKRAHTLGVAERLHLLGTVSEADKVWYLSNCKAFLHPSRAEGFGLPVLEAMQFGKPVFLSPLTALPEIGGSAAYYFPSFEAEVVQDVYRRGMLDYETSNRSEMLVAHAARFDWATSARQYLSVYESLIG